MLFVRSPRSSWYLHLRLRVFYTGVYQLMIVTIRLAQGITLRHPHAFSVTIGSQDDNPRENDVVATNRVTEQHIRETPQYIGDAEASAKPKQRGRGRFVIRS